jgi:hypothetical protein
MSDPVMVDLDRYLLAQEEAEEQADYEELEKSRERMRDVMSILSKPIELEEKARRLVSLIEFEVQEVIDESY